MKKQIIIRQMALTDFIINSWLKFRFWCLRNFYHSKLKDSSRKEKVNKYLVFNDDFDVVSWSDDPKRKVANWNVGESWGAYRHNTPIYFGAPTLIPKTSCAKFTIKYKPATFKEGDKILVIPFEASTLSSDQTFKQQYGRFECRCTIPFDKGTWPAFWTWGSTWPPEIDVFEMYGGKDGKKAGVQKINLHYGEYNTSTYKNIKPWSILVDKKSKYYEPRFHEFAVEWTPTKIEMFTDGIKVFRFTNKKVLEWFNKDTTKQWIVINHSIEGKYVKDDEKTYYSEFLVDYIRAYEHVKV